MRAAVQSTTNWVASSNRRLLSHISGVRKYEITVWGGHAPSKGPKGKSSLPLPVSGGSWHYWACSCITPLLASVFTWPSSQCVSVSSPLLKRTPVTVSRAHLKSRMISSPEFKPSAKAVFPNSHSEVSGGCEFWRMLFNYYTFTVKNDGGNSLAVQWLGLCVSTEGRTSSIPGQGSPACCTDQNK